MVVKVSFISSFNMVSFAFKGACKCAWENANHVVEHWIENIKLYFCLNCEDWVQHKSNVLKDGWSLFDEEGLLRRDV